MPGATGKGVPYSQGGDPVSSIDTTMQALAEWVDARGGIPSMGTTTRDALPAIDRWANRIIWNASTNRLERWNAFDSTWQPVFNTSYTLRDTHTFVVQGDVLVDNVQNDYYIAPFFVEVAAGKTMTLRAVRHRLRLGGPVTFAIDRTTAAGATTRIGSYTATTTSARGTTGLPVTLADGDMLSLVVTATNGGSKHLTASLAYDTTV